MRRPPPAPTLSLDRVERARQAGRGIGQHSNTPPPPSPSPTWAEVTRGGSSRGKGSSSDQTRAKPPAADSNSSSARPIYTYTDTGSSPLPLPSAHSQYLAWVSCRRDGVPARLVLETDGVTEEICLWFRPVVNSNGGRPAADAATHAPTSGKRRRERARRRRRREERRGEADKNCTPSYTSTAGVATAAATGPPALPQEASLSPGHDTTETDITEPTLPLSATLTVRAHVYKARPLALKRTKAALTATRASQRAAVLAKKRGTAATQRSASKSTPEKLRDDEGETALDITMGLSSPPPPPFPPAPASTPTLASHTLLQLPSPTASPSPPAQASSVPPPPPPMHAKFPTYFRRVICQECFYDDHDYYYKRCWDCHVNGLPHPEARLRNLKRFAVKL
jgi:hypothetical protein